MLERIESGNHRWEKVGGGKYHLNILLLYCKDSVKDEESWINTCEKYL